MSIWKTEKDRELSSDLHTVLDRSLLCLEYTCVPLSNVDLTQQLENCSEEVSQYRPVPIVYMWIANTGVWTRMRIPLLNSRWKLEVRVLIPGMLQKIPQDVTKLIWCLRFIKGCTVPSESVGIRGKVCKNLNPFEDEHHPLRL